MRKSKQWAYAFFLGVIILPQKTFARRNLTVSILSLSLLTVMAGAAVAPALGVIQAYFAESSQFFIQMIVSVPALFIVFTNFLFPSLCRRFGAKTLVLIGLLLYTVGGCLAGIFNSIILVLITRALVGIGVGIIMPLSTGLLAYYFKPQEQIRLMGYSSAMNQMGGVIATLLAGLLANISWRASFLVYLLGLLSIILCLCYLPNNKITPPSSQPKTNANFAQLWRSYHIYILAMFLLMSAFFIYPTNFSFITIADVVIPAQFIAIIMALMDFIAFFGGLFSASARQIFRQYTKFLAPVCFLAGYLLMSLSASWLCVLAGSILIGFANGAGIPYIISEASLKAGKAAATTVMPLLSAALYLAQFISSMLLSVTQSLFGALGVHLPYFFGLLLTGLFCLCSALLPKSN